MSLDVTSPRRSFADAPELQVRVEEPVVVEPEVVAAVAGALEQAVERVEETERQAFETREELADSTYENAVLDVSRLMGSQGAETLNRLADLAGVGDYRTMAALEAWGQVDPAGAYAWADEREQALKAQQVEAVVQERTAQVAAAQARATEALNDAWAGLQRRHGRELAENPRLREALDMVAAATAAGDPTSFLPERVAATLADVHRRAREVVRAHDAAQREHDLRQAFRQPSFADAKHGREAKEPLPPPELEDVAARLRPQHDVRAAAAAQHRQEFREAFAAETQGRRAEWAAENRKAAAEAMREQKATGLSRARGY